MESLFQQDLTSAQSRGMGMDISKWGNSTIFDATDGIFEITRSIKKVQI